MGLETGFRNPFAKGFLTSAAPIKNGAKRLVRNDKNYVYNQQNMREKRSYYVYILASFSGTLYVGVTNDIEGRMQQHKSQTIKGFTEKYGVTRLLYYEEFDDVHMAIAREKEIKKWRREKKISLFEETNPGWEDLSKEWFED